VVGTSVGDTVDAYVIRIEGREVGCREGLKEGRMDGVQEGMKDGAVVGLIVMVREGE